MRETRESISQKQERPPALDRIVSTRLTEEEKRELVIYFKKVFDRQELEELKSGEIMFNDEQRSLAESGNNLINQELNRYGINAMNVPTANIHVLNAQQFKQFGDRYGQSLDKCDAVTSLYDQTILLKDRERSRYDFLAVVMHEVLHLKSFISMQTIKVDRNQMERLGVNEVLETERETDDDYIITARRQGWNVEEAKKDGRGYFHNIDEALIEHFTINTIRKRGVEIFGGDFEISENLRHALINYIGVILTNKSLSQKSRAMFENQLAWLEENVLFLPGSDKIWGNYENADEKQKLIVLLDALEYYAGERFKEADQFHYVKERRFLKKLIGELYKRNKNDFSSEDEILALFIKGGFDGNIMPVSRLVEKTFGKGSFRKLGEGVDITK